MKKLVRLGACLAVLAAVLVALTSSVSTVQARGALAIGDCGAWGGSWNYDDDEDARERARSECKGRNCKVVTSFEGLWAAFAVDRSRSCGAWGWATRQRQSQAEDVAIDECEKAGGRNCQIRARFCDGR